MQFFSSTFKLLKWLCIFSFISI